MLKGWFSIKNGKANRLWQLSVFFLKLQGHAASSQKPTKAAQEAFKPMEVCELHRSKMHLSKKILLTDPIICYICLELAIFLM